MHPLLLTIATLLVLAALVAGKMAEGLNRELVNHLNRSFTAVQTNLEEERESSKLHAIKILEGEETHSPKEKKKQQRKRLSLKSPSLQVNFARPPDKAFLNIYDTDDPEIWLLLRKLLYRLYGNSSYVPTFLNALQSKKMEFGQLADAPSLCTLTFDKKEEQEAVYALLNGFVDEKGTSFPSLLYFIRLDQEKCKKINFLFAPEELLEAIIDHPDAFKRALATRQFFLELIEEQEESRLESDRGQCLGRQALKDNIRADVEAIFKCYRLNIPYLSYGLGKQGSFLIVTDPITKMRIREKVASQ